jgi:hypothetical protein
LNHDPFCDHSANVECELEDVVSWYKEILQAKMLVGTKQIYDMQTILQDFPGHTRK